MAIVIAPVRPGGWLLGGVRGPWGVVISLPMGAASKRRALDLVGHRLTQEVPNRETLPSTRRNGPRLCGDVATALGDPVGVADQRERPASKEKKGAQRRRRARDPEGETGRTGGHGDAEHAIRIEREQARWVAGPSGLDGGARQTEA